MKKRFFVLLLCLAMALGMFAAAENMDAQTNQYTFYVDGAEYMSDALLPEVREKGLSALLLQGPAAEDAASAQEALKEERAFSVGRIGEITEALFPTDMSPAQEAQGAAMPLAAAPSLRSGGPASLDGTTIEKVEVRWMTADTIENNNADLLYLKPPADNSMSVKYQLSYALSGEHDYAPGDLTITIPGQIFRDRNGKLIGSLTIPYAENPSMKTEFNWMQVGEDYVLTNTRRMSAATKGYIQFLISGITPHVVADMSVTEDLTAKVEVVTHEGNVLSLESNAITAQVDTQAKVNIATKRASSVTWIDADKVPQELRIEGEEEYIKVEWYAFANITANTMYRLDVSDTMHDEYGGFMLGATSEDGLQKVSPTSTGRYRSGDTEYYWYSCIYPASRFQPDTTYTFHNDVTFTVTEEDPAVGEDPQLVTSATAHGVRNWSYTDPQWIDPTGHFMIYKNGNDDKEQYGASKWNYTHGGKWGTGSGSDTHLRGHGYYGIYPSALNHIQEKEDVTVSYTIDSVGYVMPWMFDKASYAADGAMAPRLARNFSRSVTITSRDTGPSIGRYGKKLKLGEDYEYVSVEMMAPWIYEGTPHNINEDGSWSAKHAQDGTFLYTRDNSVSNWPDIRLQIQREGKWEDWATASWSSGSLQITLASGGTQTAAVVAVPSDTENFRTIVTLHNTQTTGNVVRQAAIDYDVRVRIKLKNTEALTAKVEAAFVNNNTPRIELYNAAEMSARVEDTGNDIVTIERDGYNSLRGYTPDTMIHPSKSASSSAWDVDYTNSRVTIHYSAKVEERSVISDLTTYRQAVADGKLLTETHGTWYDLLPKGATPVLSSVRLRSGDRITNLYTVKDYKQSGRTLLVVEADLKFSPTTYRSGDMTYYEDVPSISFNAYYDFTSISDYGVKPHNVIAFQSGNATLGTVEGYTGEPDDPSAGNNTFTKSAFKDDAEKSVMTDLDPDGDDPVFVYAGAWTQVDMLHSGQSSLDKEVSVNEDGYWSDGIYNETQYETAQEAPDGRKRTVYEGGVYSYRLRVVSEVNTISKNIILYDSLENFVPGAGNEENDIGAARWQGTFTGIDVRQLEDKGCRPVVYYSTQPGLTFFGETPAQANADNTDLSNTDVWTKAEDYQGPPSAVKAVAVDARKDKNGNAFKLMSQESIAVLIHMHAPSDDAAQDAMDKNAHAYNSAYMICSSSRVDQEESYETSYVHKDYTKVGIRPCEVEAKKIWNDDGDRDGKRPQSVTLRLYANGKETEKTLTLPINGVWEGTFKHLTYMDEQGVPIRYSVKEDEIEGYTGSLSMDGDCFVFTNTHVPERTSVSGSKTWLYDLPSDRPRSIRILLYGNDEWIATKTVSAADEWRWTFTNLFKYANGGKEIVYRVEEEDVPSYKSTPEGMNVTNTFHPYGDLRVSKTVTDTTSVSAEKEFAFTFTFTKTEEGETVPVQEEFDYEVLSAAGGVLSTGKIGTDGSIAIKGGQSILVREVPRFIRYTVREAELPGFTLTAADGTEGVITANETKNASFTNRYSASGKIDLAAQKVLENRALRKNQFVFDLYRIAGEALDPATDELVRTARNAAPSEPVLREDGTIESSRAAIMLGVIRYTEADAGKTYRYALVERDDGRSGYTYDDTVYYIEVTVTDNGDGTLDVAPVYYRNGFAETDKLGENEGFLFTNTYRASGSIALRAWKELKGGALADAEGDFSFDLLNEDLTVVLDTKTNDAEGNIAFDELAFTEKDIGKTYYYAFREAAGNDSAVIYDGRVFWYYVTVADNGDGTLSFDSASATPVYREGGTAIDRWTQDEPDDQHPPVFVNRLMNGSLSVGKSVEDVNNPDPSKLFTFRLRLTGEDVDENTVTNDTVTIASLPEAAPGEGGGAPGPDAAGPLGMPAGAAFSAGAAKDASANDPNKPEPFYATQDMLVGDAYAVYRNGTLTFFRSNENYTNNTYYGTVKDIKGNTYSGTVYADFEEATVANYSNRPWLANRQMEYYIRTVTIAEGQAIKPYNTARWFDLCHNLSNIDLSRLDTSRVTNMTRMFHACGSLTELDVTRFDTSRVTDMSGMFWYCSSLTELDVTGFNTSSVTTMASMFANCNSLTELDVTGFDTSKVSSMYAMFANCSSLTELDLSSFDTSSVVTTYRMFRDCKNLEHIFVSDLFDLSKVQPGDYPSTDYSSNSSKEMFAGCDKLHNFNRYNTDKKYAIIDDGTNGGYFESGIC